VNPRNEVPRTPVKRQPDVPFAEPEAVAKLIADREIPRSGGTRIKIVASPARVEIKPIIDLQLIDLPHTPAKRRNKSVAPAAPSVHSLHPDQRPIEGQAMGHEATVTVAGDRCTIDGTIYFSLESAAREAQTTKKNLRDWIKSKLSFGGHTIQTRKLPFAGKRLYVTEESVRRMAERFTKWPSNEPAGRVALGKSRDHMGFISTPEAAQILNVSPRTMWLWAKEGNAPTDQTLEVVRCTTSDHFYVLEKDVRQLKKILPRAGLQRGRRAARTSLVPT
jgi:hypothetical protein